MSQQKIEKRRRNKARDAVRESDRARTLARRSAFPEVIYVPNNAPGTLIDEVKRSIEKLIDSAALDKNLRKNLSAVRTGKYQRNPRKTDLSVRLGNLVYELLNVNFQSIHRMAYDIEFDVGQRNPKCLTVIFRALDAPTSRVFCSPKRYTVEFDGRPLIVAYSDHAIERIGERTVIAPGSYIDRGKTFAFPYRHQYFELVFLPNREPALKIWDYCNPDTFLGSIHAELLGPDIATGKVEGFPYFSIGGKLCYYLVGYCPATARADLPEYLVLKTLLLPGMENTPEFDRFVRSRRLDTKARMEFCKRVGRASFAGLQKSRDFDLIRLLHEFAPQVKAIGDEVFDYPRNSIVKLRMKDVLAIQKHLTQ